MDLGIQDLQENSEFVWVTKEDLHMYTIHATEVAVDAIEYWLKTDQEMLNEGAYLSSQNKYWKKRKKRLLDLGPNKHTGGGKGHTKASYEKSKAAPPDFAVLEEEEEQKKSLKVKINKKKH